MNGIARIDPFFSNLLLFFLYISSSRPNSSLTHNVKAFKSCSNPEDIIGENDPIKDKQLQAYTYLRPKFKCRKFSNLRSSRSLTDECYQLIRLSIETSWKYAELEYDYLFGEINHNYTSNNTKTILEEGWAQNVLQWTKCSFSARVFSYERKSACETLSSIQTQYALIVQSRQFHEIHTC